MRSYVFDAANDGDRIPRQRTIRRLIADRMMKDAWRSGASVINLPDSEAQSA